MTVATHNSKALPVLDLARQFSRIRDEVLAAIGRVCESQQFILGAEVEALETEIAEFIGAKAAVGCASGTDALWLALLAAGVKPGDRVVTTPFSFFASASSIVRAGAEPVFVDIDPNTLNLDPEAVRARLKKQRHSANTRTRLPRNRAEVDGPNPPLAPSARTAIGNDGITAILPVHLYGQCANWDEFRKIAAEYNVLLIEDAAQAMGAKWRNRSAGSLGDSAAFSFYPSKNLSAYGEAGLVTAQDKEMAEHVRRLRNHGSRERYLHSELGWNARMDAIQAAVLRVKLKYINVWNQQRRERAKTYDDLLEAAGLTGLGSIRRPQTSSHALHVFHQYVIQAERRDELRAFLGERGIGTEVYYPIPLHLQPALAYLGYKEGDLPESERAAKQVLALPMFPELTQEEQLWVVKGIAEFYS